MRSTLILEVSEKMSDFIQNQQGAVDPSALVNLLLRKQMARENFQTNPSKTKTDRNDIRAALEDFVDQDTHAAG